MKVLGLQNEQIEATVVLIPSEPPSLDENLEPGVEFPEADPEPKGQLLHSIEEYCAYCQTAADLQQVRPIYIGYAVVPVSAMGVCR